MEQTKQQENILAGLAEDYKDLLQVFNKFDVEINNDAIDNMIYTLERLKKA